jgi:hypothetical protein
MDIRFKASRDAYRMSKEILKLNLTSKKIKTIARQQAREGYPRGTKLERGLYAHQFFRKIRQCEQQALHDEWSQDARF